MIASMIIAAPAAADQTFVVTNPSVQAEYGSYWSFDVAATETAYGFDWSIAASVDGAPADYAPLAYASANTSNNLQGGVLPSSTARPLEVGTYPVAMTLLAGNVAVSTTSAQLTITPAKVGVELLVLPDANNSDNVILSARFTGQFASSYTSSSYPTAAMSPSGTWRINVTDSTGKSVLEKDIERAAGDDVLATSLYWRDAVPGERYSATAEFVPNGATANNFDFIASTSVDYTAGPAARPVPTSTASPAPVVADPAPTGTRAPLWALLAGAVVIVALAVLLIILLVRGRRAAPAVADAAETIELEDVL